LNDAALEAIFQWNAQARAIADWSKANRIRRVAIADVSKNIYATYRGCQLANLEIAAVLENGPAFAGFTYRQLPVIADARAGNQTFDGIVLSTVNPALVERRTQELEAWYNKPLLRLWEPKFLEDGTGRPQEIPVAPDPAFLPTNPSHRPAA
jgi:hypothetical protein